MEPVPEIRTVGPPPSPAPALVLATVVLLALLVPSVAADGIGVSPAKVQIEEGFPGEVYTRTVTVQNRFPTATNVTLTPLGEVGGWISTSPGPHLVVGPNADRDIRVNLTLPEDAAVGTHRGELRVVAESQEERGNGSSGSSVRTAVTIPLNVTITGERRVDVQLLEARTPDVEAGEPPTVQVILSNQGNVVSRAPLVSEVLDATGQPLLAANRTHEIVPGETRAFPVSFREGLPTGTYEVRVASPDIEALDATTHLTVVPPGALGKAGDLERILHDPRGEVGKPLHVTARFTNTGNATIARAVFQANVYVGDELVDVLRTEGLTVPVGETIEFDAFATPSDPGQHRILGSITFDGIESSPVASTFHVQGDQTGEGDPQTTPGPGLAILAVLGAAAWIARERRGPDAPGG